MRIMLDTNIILDFYEDRGLQTNYAKKIMVDLWEDGIDCFITASQIKDLFYIKRKDDLKKLKDFSKGLLNDYNVVEINRKDVELALESAGADIEDMIIAFTSKRYELDYIITNNIADYKDSPVKAITSIEFVEMTEQNK